MTDEHKITVEVHTGNCPLCGQPGSIIVNQEQAGRLVAWQAIQPAARPFVQAAFPDLSAGDREQLINGTHEACFDKAFPAEEE
jgi:hypothetical protein